MSTMKSLEEMAAIEVWNGVIARPIDGERMTVSMVEIPAGQHVPEHRHDNEQIGFVIRGQITFTIGDEKRTLGPGGSWNIPSNVPHSCDVGPAGVLVAEAFAPTRSDWAALPRLADPTPVAWPATPNAAT
jgi:quercetin dioxygenase-like cupin family protein